MSGFIPRIKSEPNELDSVPPVSITLPLPAVMTVVDIKFKFPHNERIIYDRPPLNESLQAIINYDIVNPNLPPFEVAFHEEDMCFEVFREKVFDRIAESAIGDQFVGLREALEVAYDRFQLQWVYIVTEPNHSAAWSRCEALWDALWYTILLK
ncbi:hypothetical protein PGT21_009117 [Puccinia graminis f. sp. tritici]|uniref:Uncharacterized protein n=1 Tax=Puccinia graminis f. sp. tritici TaxID=56615 RepID=A0A5B0S6M8_PUCGR|nr:hypothetical protein PGT21_009117 [Puccinia graminis f. sp. tritici]KAA1133462.1 hypothetical protein PGTUg99_014873 [Puccinia graminis f. sp. tritici]